MARYGEVILKETDLRDNACREMADEVKFHEGMGQPVVVFDLQPVTGKADVEAKVWTVGTGNSKTGRMAGFLCFKIYHSCR